MAQAITPLFVPSQVWLLSFLLFLTGHLKLAEVRNVTEHVASAFVVLYFIEAHSWRKLLVVMPFTVKCHLCSKKFRTGFSLRKHFDLKHHRRNLERARFQDDSGILVEEPKAVALVIVIVALVNGESDYLEWLGVLVERINASLVPDHPGTQYFTRNKLGRR